MAGNKMQIELITGLEPAFFFNVPRTDIARPKAEVSTARKECASTASSRTSSPMRMEPTSFGSIASTADGGISTPRHMGMRDEEWLLWTKSIPGSEPDAKIHISLEALVQSDKPGGTSSFASTAATQEESVGSVGHPDSCRPPCKYVRRKGGCRDGANCPNCHFCEWRRAARMKEQSADAVQANVAKRMPPPGMCMLSVANGCPSVGSVGHPNTCAAPCKYFFKTSGCKDGGACTRCHICPWSRKQERTKVEAGQTGEMQGPDIDPPTDLPVPGLLFSSHTGPRDAPMYVSVADSNVGGRGVRSF